MFYRIAMQAGASPSWQWKSTPLSSLDAVLGFLRLHRALPQDRLRVFSSASREGLDEQFKRERGAMGFHSVTATRFLRERLISPGDTTRETSEQKTQENQEAVFTEVVLSPSLYGSSKRTPTLDRVSRLDCKRLEIERGAGGDHDLPYHFAFPHVWSQVRAWTELLVQIQRGELQP
jgi:hypothetical protein